MRDTRPQAANDDFEALFSQKMPTGIAGLDHLLEGGITRTNSLLVEGSPGSGKSTLGVQILVRGAEIYSEPAVMVAFEEFPRQLFSEYATFGFDLADLEKRGLLRIIWTDPRKVIQGFTGKDDLVGRIIDEMGARRLMIDSITHFRRVAAADIDLREVLYKVLNNLKLKGVNSILIKELEGGDQDSIAFEEYVVDASIRVFNESPGATAENRRFLQIRKTRGQSHISGYHPFSFSDRGIEVFPALRPIDVDLAIPFKKVGKGRKETGIESFDQLIEGGFPEGSLNIVVGYSGTGKTTLARHFLAQRLAKGEKGLVLSFQEDAEGFLQKAESLGLDLRPAHLAGQLQFWNLSPVGLCPERFLHKLIEELTQQPFDCMVWDSISDLRTIIRDPDYLREINHLIARILKRAGLTVLLVHESNEMSGLIPLGNLDFAQLADSITQLSFAEIDGKVHRFIGVMKMAATNHSKHLHEFQITSQGMSLLNLATGMSGILSGRAEGKMEAVAEQVLDPLMDSSEGIRSILQDASLSPELRERLVHIRKNLGLADIVLRDHFGMSDWQALVEDPEVVQGEKPRKESD